MRDVGLLYRPNPPKAETRTLSLNFARNVAIRQNVFETINGVATNNNDGETILSEQGGPGLKPAYYGYVDEDPTNASSLKDSRAAWNKLDSATVAIIIGGKGVGQWRHVAPGNTSTSLTVTQAWEVVPDATSRYSLTSWSAENWLVKDNVLRNNRAGLEFFACSANELAIVDNQLLNNDGILLRPGQLRDSNRQLFNPVYNTQIIGNRVEDQSPNAGAPAYIGLLPYQFLDPNTIGTSAIGVEVRRNYIKARPSYVISKANNNELGTEGYYNYLLYQFDGTNGDTPVTLGTIFENNTAEDTPSAFYLNSGAYNTLICNTTLLRAGKLLRDEKQAKTSHASVNTDTVSCPTVRRTLRAPENPVRTVAGLDYQYYEGSWNQLPDFNNLATPIKAGTIPTTDISIAQRDYGYAVQYTGFVTVPTDGEYTFYTNSDDGSKLYIGSTVVVDNDGGHGPQERSGTIGLEAGTHAFTVTYFQNGGGQSLDVSYQGPTLPKQLLPTTALRRAIGLRSPENPANKAAGLDYQYYEGSWDMLPDFATLSPTATGTVNDFDLRVQQRDYAFGLQYTGFVTVPTDGEYTFYTNSDDGSKLYIGSTVVVDNDGGHGPQERSGTIGLRAGTHALTLAYMQNGGAQSLVVSYQTASLSKRIIPAGALWRMSATNRLAAVKSADAAVVQFAEAVAATPADSAHCSLQVYPNPLHETGTVEYTATAAQLATLTLTDRLGRTVKQQQVRLQPGRNQCAVDVQNLPAGLYHLTLLSADRQAYSLKVVVFR